MSRDISLYLEDILDACEKIEMYVEGVSRAQLEDDPMRFDAIVRNIEIIGEAARQLPESVLADMPEVPWTRIIGMRNILAHAYFGVDVDIVWDVATQEVQRLLATVHSKLA